MTGIILAVLLVMAAVWFFMSDRTVSTVGSTTSPTTNTAPPATPQQPPAAPVVPNTGGTTAP